MDYTDSYTLTGELATNVTSVNPYVGWQAPGGMNLWATAGYGWGEVEIDDESAAMQASDLTQKLVAAGVSGDLVSSDELIGGGTTNLRLKGETAFTWADVDGSGNLEKGTTSECQPAAADAGREPCAGARLGGYADTVGGGGHEV